MDNMEDNPYIQATALHLETIARTFITAIDQRLLTGDPSAISDPRLNLFDPLFRASPMPPWDSAPLDITEFAQYVKTVVDAHPEYSIKASELNCHVNDRAGTADVFMNIEIGGVPPGVVRRSVGVLKFRRNEGVWRCFTYEGADGIECSGGERR